jgi:hypothetical protein
MAGGHGGRRAGAGRPSGSGWKPHVASLRVAAVEQMQEIVGSDRDPLAVVIAMACDMTLDKQTRLGAAAIALPYLYPRLAASGLVQMRPRIQPAEFIARLSARGISLTATPAGDLVARPASLLTDADRTVLRDIKPGIVAALAGDAETL